MKASSKTKGSTKVMGLYKITYASAPRLKSYFLNHGPGMALAWRRHGGGMEEATFCIEELIVVIVFKCCCGEDANMCQVQNFVYRFVLSYAELCQTIPVCAELFRVVPSLFAEG